MNIALSWPLLRPKTKIEVTDSRVEQSRVSRAWLAGNGRQGMVSRAWLAGHGWQGMVGRAWLAEHG